MRDIRLEEMPFEFDGKLFKLRCNMNVLADVQEEFGGQISGALSGEKPTRSVLAFVAAMLNDYADEQGWEERYTAKDIGRKLAINMLPAGEIMALVTRSIAPPKEEETETPEESGN